MASLSDGDHSTTGGGDMGATPVHDMVPDWLIPPAEGFTAEDLDRLPGLPAHTELIDGSLVFVSPQAIFHMFVLRLLERRLEAAAPHGMAVVREVTISLGPRQRPEPDLMVVDTQAITDLDQSALPASSVRLAVEVVSPESQVRDRKRKPQLYAEAGIPHFWRVEKEASAPIVYTYERDPATGDYLGTGIHRGRLGLQVPFGIDIDLTEIDRM